MFRTTGYLLALGMLSTATQAQTDVLDAYAVVGARIEVGDGRVIEKGTVLLRDGRIMAVGAGVVVPAGFEIVRGEGLTVYPGFIDSHRTEGLNPPAPQSTQDVAPDTTSEAPASMRAANRKGVRPELHSLEVLALTDAQLRPARQNGWTTALIAPTGGNINGVAALVNLSGQPARDAVVRPEVAQCFALTPDRQRFTPGQPFRDPGYPGSLLGVFAHTRQALLDARRYATLKSTFEQGGAVRPPADPVLAALQPTLEGALPALFEADTENEIVRALRFADEFKLRPMLCGAQEAWKQADLLAQRQIPVLVGLNFGEEPGAKSAKPDSSKAPAKPETTPNPAEPKEQTEKADDKAKPETRAKPTEADTDAEEEVPPAILAEQVRLWKERVQNAQMLHKAGISFAFTTRGVRTPADFWKNLRRAIKEGLPREVALSALTRNAARLLGMERQMGTVEAGKIANLVIMTGDFAAEGSKVKYLFVDARKFDIERDASNRPPVPSRPRFDLDSRSATHSDTHLDDDPHGDR